MGTAFAISATTRMMPQSLIDNTQNVDYKTL